MKQYNKLGLAVVLTALMLMIGCAGKKTTEDSSLGSATDGSSSMGGTDSSTGSGSSMDSGMATGLSPIYFDYNQYTLSSSARSTLKGYYSTLKSANDGVLIEGHCDERGTDEYNMALGERRAKVIRDYLVNLGMPSSRLNIISYGEERPATTAQDDASWAQNRRGEFIISK